MMTGASLRCAGAALLACAACGEDMQGQGPGPNVSQDGSAVVRFDNSGSDRIPNNWVRSVDELPVYSLGGSGLFPASSGSGYRIIFASGGEDGGELEFQLDRLFAGTYDLNNVDGELKANGLSLGSGVYGTRVDGGRGTLQLSPGPDDTVVGRFEGRVCLERTPRFNCSSFYLGEFTAPNLTGLPLEAPERFEIPDGYPQIDSVTRAAITYNNGATARGSVGLTPRTGTIRAFSVDTLEENKNEPSKSFTFFFPRLDPEDFELTEYGARVGYSNRGKGYGTRHGGGGSMSIDGRDGNLIWGSFDVRTCYGRTPGSNCFNFAGRFAALDE